jgi:ATP-binding cassette subfamily B protein
MKPYRAHFALGVLALAATNFFGYLTPQLVKSAIDMLTSGFDAHRLVLITAGIAGAALMQSLIRVASRLLIFNAARDVERDLREALFAHLLALSPQQLGERSVGDLQSRITNDLTNVRLLFGAGVLNVANTVVAYAVAIPLMLAQHARLALIALSPYPVMIIFMQLLARRIFTSSADTQARLGGISNLVNEDLGARLFIGAAGLGALEERRFATVNDSYLKANLVLVRTRAIMIPVMTSIGAVGIALSLWLGGREVIAGTMTLGTLVAFNTYLALLAFPTVMLGFFLAVVQRGLASYERVDKLFQEKPWASPAKAPMPAEGALSVRHLSLERGGTRVLSDVTIDIPLGARIGIVGEVGSGKSSLLLALARLIDVPEGTLLLDGLDVHRFPLRDVRRLTGYVPQQPFLFSMSIAENIAFGRDALTREQIVDAATLADLHKDIITFPQGYETLVGERGVTLSGGQKQRLALARALAAQPQVLLLDDCFSAVDTETERNIIEHLMGKARARSMVIASHRLSVFDHADRIFVLDKGQLVEAGTAPELLARGGVFARLYQRQRLREQVEEVA